MGSESINTPLATTASITLSAMKYVSGDSNHICRLCFATTEEEVVLQDTIRVQRSYIDENVSFLHMFADLGVSKPFLVHIPETSRKLRVDRFIMGIILKFALLLFYFLYDYPGIDFFLLVISLFCL